jgi:hypothetical protein
LKAKLLSSQDSVKLRALEKVVSIVGSGELLSPMFAAIDDEIQALISGASSARWGVAPVEPPEL